MSEAQPTVEYRGIEGRPYHRVGDDGSVWSCRNNRWGVKAWWRLKTGRSVRGGYRTVGLHAGGGALMVHHLVLEAFVGPRPEGCECRHLDGDPANNRLSNLRWGTAKENAGDRVRHGTVRKGEGQWAAKLTEDAVRDIRANCPPPLPGRTRRRDGAKTRMAAKYGVSLMTISEVVRGKIWSHVV